MQFSMQKVKEGPYWVGIVAGFPSPVYWPCTKVALIDHSDSWKVQEPTPYYKTSTRKLNVPEDEGQDERRRITEQKAQLLVLGAYLCCWVSLGGGARTENHFKLSCRSFSEHILHMHQFTDNMQNKGSFLYFSLWEEIANCSEAQYYQIPKNLWIEPITDNWTWIAHCWLQT